MTGGPSLERIEEALSELGQEYRSPPGWEERVRAATRRGRQRRWVALGAFVAAAAAVLVWWWSGPGRRAADPRPRSQPAFAFGIQSRGGVVRGDAPVRPGDTLKATVRGAKHRAMWLYRDDERVLRCPGQKGCASSDRVLSLEMELGALGRYTLIAVRHDAPLPESRGDFDGDLAAVKRAGASIDRGEFIVE